MTHNFKRKKTNNAYQSAVITSTAKEMAKPRVTESVQIETARRIKAGNRKRKP